MKRAIGREEARAYQRAQADGVLRLAVELRARARYAVGHPGEVVACGAVHGHPDLVVMGSRGQTALQVLVFGSVIQAVLAASTVPLLVLRRIPPVRQESLRVAGQPA